MPLLKHLCLPEFRFVLWTIEETENELLSLLPPSLREHYDMPLQALTHRGRRLEWLATRVSLHCGLSIDTPITYREDGSPHLDGSSLHISVAHSQGRVAVIVSEHPVGTDIEYITERAQLLQSRFLTSEEQAVMAAGLSTTHPQTACVMAWAAKEAAFKCFSQTNPVKLLADTTLTGIRRGTATLVSSKNEVCRATLLVHDGYAIAMAFGKGTTISGEDVVSAFQ